MSRPTTGPLWATDTNYDAPGEDWDGEPTKTVPSSGEIEQGFAPKQRPPADTVNYLIGNHGEWINFIDSQFGSGIFGNGSTGDHTVSTAPEVLGAIKFYDNLTIDDACGIAANGYPIYVRDTLTFGDTSYISNNASNGTAGNNAGGNALGGGGGAGTFYHTFGQDGGAANSESVGSVGGEYGGAGHVRYGGAGGRGGASSFNTFGVGGGSTGGHSDAPYQFPSFLTLRLNLPNSSGLSYYIVPGEGGGGGGGGNTGDDTSGGSGGGGAGIIWIAARKLVIPTLNGNRFSAIGGNGGNGVAASGPVTGTGGGGGGGGGAIFIIYSELDITGGDLVDNCNVSGGGAGTGGGAGGANGVAGGAGKIYLINA